MTYITWSRKLNGTSASEICGRIAELVRSPSVERRGTKSIGKVLIDARSKGHSRAVLLASAKGGALTARVIGIESDLSFKWIGEYTISAAKGRQQLKITRKGEKDENDKDAKEEFIAQAEERH